MGERAAVMGDGLTKHDVAKLVMEHFGARATCLSLTAHDGVEFVLYQAFCFTIGPDDYGSGHNWGISLQVGNVGIVDLLGTSTTILSTTAQLTAALEGIDRYCRLRLGAEYLEAHDDALRTRRGGS